jgi:hypothetical protein
MAGLVVTAVSGPASYAGDVAPKHLAVLPFEIEDNSGEAGGAGRHRAMLDTLTRMVGESVAGSGRYELVAPAQVDAAVAAVNSGTYLRNCNGCELEIGKRAGADRVMVAWIFKMSSLVLSLHVVVKDVATGEDIYARVFDFRGDNEKAWKRAADYMVKALAKSEKGAEGLPVR